MQKKYASLLLPVLVLVAILGLVVSCTNSGSGEEQGSSGSEDNMKEMNHGSESTHDASDMLMENGEYSDKRFIDGMVPHHQGPISTT
jgi:uncharacterized protein (DUF305 family)